MTSSTQQSTPPAGTSADTGLDRASAAARGDRIFRAMSLAAAIFVLVLILAIAFFLIKSAIPSLQADRTNFLTTRVWFPNTPGTHFGIAALAFGTLVSSALALIIGVPIAIAVALFISHYAPRPLATVLGYVVDLLAAVPSIVFGLWGRDFLNQRVDGLSTWLNHWFGWIPIFSSSGPYGRSMLLAGIVLAIMVLPIVASLSREVFAQTPRLDEEAALALGATRWEMIRITVLPHGRPGVIAASMLGLGRALGETMAIALVLSASFGIGWQILSPGGNSIAANIANAFGEADDTGRSALIASGLVLFAITMGVNVLARAVIHRRREFTESSA